MNIFKLSLRNITSRPLTTTLSLVLLTLGVGMIALLIQINQQVQEQMGNNVRGIDMVVGAKGSPLQLILSAVYHIDAPTGNITLNEVKKLEQNRLIAKTIPLSYGDNYQGYRIVGTTHQYAELYQATLAVGQLWQNPLEVTVGASIAKELNLAVGDTFLGEHGLNQGGESHEEDVYSVVGIFNPTNSVLDQLILTATESVWDVHHHEEESNHSSREHSHDAEEESHHHKEGELEKEEIQEITALLVKFRSPIGILQLPRMVNETTNMQAAVPAYEISRLFSLMGVGIDALGAISLLIMIVSALSVLISLYSALKERQYEMALMRTYGASRWQLVALVFQEGLFLSLAGFFMGILFSRIGLWLIAKQVKTAYHYNFEEQFFTVGEVWLLAVSIAIGLLASLIPSIYAFRINISKTLADA